MRFFREATLGERAALATEALAALGDAGHEASGKAGAERARFRRGLLHRPQGDARGGDILADLLDSEDEIEAGRRR